MANLFFIIFLVSFGALVVGLIKPALFSRFKIASRKMVAFIFGGIFIVSIIGMAVTSESPPEAIQQENPTSSEAVKPSPESKKQTTTSEGITVVSVVDGDTLKISSGEVVRLIGIDSPETKAPFYVEAKNKLTELTLNKKVRLEKDISEVDRYGRLLRYIYVGDLFINLEMVKQGYATAYTYPPDVKYSEQFVATEKEARNNKKGLWSSSTPTTTPAPTATQAPSGGNGYSLPPCASSDCDCGHFSTHAHAQWFHDNYDPSDQHRLDRDDDGAVCETLP